LIFIGLGGNLGPTAAIFRQALEKLSSAGDLTVLRSSSLWASPSWGFSGPQFHNAVVEVGSDHPPQALLGALLACERSFGRRRAARMGDRPVDLDLLAYRGLVLDEPGLTLPHPGTGSRRFVLEPLAELAPELRLPGQGLVAELLDHQRRQDAQVWQLSASSDWRRWGGPCGAILSTTTGIDSPA
jgi:2-amino-4-hydroxy-6-hydroxymethyldihydropteridine diphosphokinase